MEIQGKSFFMSVFMSVWEREKNGFLYTDGAPYRVDQLRRTASMWRRRLGGENVLPLPGLEGKKEKSSPWRSVRHSQVRSAKHSHRRGTLIFIKKIRYNSGQRSLKPAVLAGTG